MSLVATKLSAQNFSTCALVAVMVYSSCHLIVTGSAKVHDHTHAVLLAAAGRQLSEFGSFTACPAGQLHELGSGLALLPLKSRHAERCFGLLLYWQGQPLLGWSVSAHAPAWLYVWFLGGRFGMLLLHPWLAASKHAAQVLLNMHDEAAAASCKLHACEHAEHPYAM
jgi:hypothetical protein